MTATDNSNEIFDRSRRRLVRDRAYARAQGSDFFHELIGKEILERLKLVSRDFNRGLIIGLGSRFLKTELNAQNIACVTADSSFAMAMELQAVQCDEDRLPFANASFDLVIAIGSLDSVNDLPGALTLIRRILEPDGLFLGSFFGAESLSELKSILLRSDGEQVLAHIHPQIDIRTVGDLLQRAGFALPVTDSDSLEIKYDSFNKLVADIRDFGGTNILRDQTRPMTKRAVASAFNFFDEMRDNQERVSEHLELIHVSGWAPHPAQPKPARRGSGQISLKSALKDRSES